MGAPFPLSSWLLGELPDVAVFVRLYKSISPGPGTPSLSQFVEATYPGYVPQALPFPCPNTPLPDGSLWVQVDGLIFAVAPSELPGCLVLGIYLTSAEPDSVERLVAFSPLQHSQKLLKSGDWITVDVNFAALQLQAPGA